MYRYCKKQMMIQHFVSFGIIYQVNYDLDLVDVFLNSTLRLVSYFI